MMEATYKPKMGLNMKEVRENAETT